MAKITYLLGAGASAGSLPMINDFTKSIEIILRYMSSFKGPQLDFYVKENERETIVKLLNTVESDLTNLLNGCKAFRSVDTYIKNLFLKIYTEEDEKKYHVAKCSIILFFELYRFYKIRINKDLKLESPFDIEKRYDAFLATILNKDNNGDLTLPDDINILSWNYDYEFERAFLKIAKVGTNVDEMRDTLNVVLKNSRTNNNISNKFGIVKMNGTIGYFEKEQLFLGLKCCESTFEKERLEKQYKAEDYHIVYPFIKNYYEFTYTHPDIYKPAISFAWEGGDGMNDIKKSVKDVLANTEKLVIIGYSFPAFNREIDTYIMNCFKTISNIKIYVQDTEAKVNGLIEDIKELRDFADVVNEYHKIKVEAKFVPKTDLTQFYIPF